MGLRRHEWPAIKALAIGAGGGRARGLETTTVGESMPTLSALPTLRKATRFEHDLGLSPPTVPTNASRPALPRTAQRHSEQ
jgi:hypothetical protein